MKKAVLLIALVVLLASFGLAASEISCNVKSICSGAGENPILYLNQGNNAHAYKQSGDAAPQILCCSGIESVPTGAATCSEGIPIFYLSQENNAHVSIPTNSYSPTSADATVPRSLTMSSGERSPDLDGQCATRSRSCCGCLMR